MQVAPANRRYLQAGALPWCTDCWVFLLINGRFGPVGSSETAVVATSTGHKGANPNKLQREAFLFGATPARRSNRVCGPLVVSVGLQLPLPKEGAQRANCCRRENGGWQGKYWLNSATRCWRAPGTSKASAGVPFGCHVAPPFVGDGPKKCITPAHEGMSKWRPPKKRFHGTGAILV